MDNQKKYTITIFTENRPRFAAERFSYAVKIIDGVLN